MIVDIHFILHSINIFIFIFLRSKSFIQIDSRFLLRGSSDAK
jgi:hypothetical protein